MKASNWKSTGDKFVNVERCTGYGEEMYWIFFVFEIESKESLESSDEIEPLIT